MKTLIVWFRLVAGCLLAAASVSAQDFSGTVTWIMRVEITDPELKAQLDAAQAALSNPAMQDLLESNPQMREMLEKQMGGSSAAAAGGFFPKGFTLQIKGSRSLVKTEGGVAAGDVLTQADKNVSYQIDRKARTYYKLAADPLKDYAGNYKVTSTAVTANVLGYTCRRFVVETTDAGEKMSYSIWATNDIKGLDAASLRRLKFGESAGSEFLAKIDGIPLKIDAITPQAKLFMVATAVQREALPDSLFTLPAGFKQTAPPSQ
jgi:hypothetical protein